MITVKYCGRTANQLFQYCFGRILSEQLQFDFKALPIDGFYIVTEIKRIPTRANKLPVQKLTGHLIDLHAVLNDKTLRNIVLDGFFQRAEYYSAYLTSIRNNWIVPVSKPTVSFNSDDVIIHFRLTDLYSVNTTNAMTQYYKRSLAYKQWSHIYVVSDDVHNQYIKTVLCDHAYTVISDNHFVHLIHCPYAILSQSTFGIFARLLGDTDLDKTIMPYSVNEGYITRSDLNWRFFKQLIK